MNAPFKPDGARPLIEDVLADACVSISSLKANPAAVVAAARERQVAVLSRNRPVAYVVSPEAWAGLCELVEEARDAELLNGRLTDGETPVPVDLADL